MRQWLHNFLKRKTQARLDDARIDSGSRRSFQTRTWPWLLACFGYETAMDRRTRSFRFLEESLELVQAAGCTKEAALQLVDYTYGRPVGVVRQEVGGVMVTLAALCLAHNLDMHDAGDVELDRVWTMVRRSSTSCTTTRRTSS